MYIDILYRNDSLVFLFWLNPFTNLSKAILRCDTSFFWFFSFNLPNVIFFLCGMKIGLYPHPPVVIVFEIVPSI